MMGMLLMQISASPPLHRCQRLCGGGDSLQEPFRAPLPRLVKKALPALPPFPPPRKPVALPITQLPSMVMVVADSTLTGARQGLFTLTPVDTEELICLYAGTKIRNLSAITEDFPRFDYVWSNSDQSIIIDAYPPHSCFGRYANDALYESKCNAIIEERNGKVFLISTRPLAANEEIFVNYGDGYWADRFHLYWPPHSMEYSSLQRDLIRAYHLIPLPDGTSITQKEAKQRRPYSFPSLPPRPPLPLSLSKLDTIAGTYGSSKNYCAALSFGSNKGVSDHIHLLMSALLTNPLSSSVTILKKFLREYHSLIGLHIWRSKSLTVYKACPSELTCDYQLLYHMYLRGSRVTSGLPADEFPDLLSSHFVDEFRSFLDTLLKKYDDVPLSQRPLPLGIVQRYLLWLNSPLPRPPFLKDLLDLDSVLKFADKSFPFSMAVDDPILPLPSISDQWAYVWGDSKLTRSVPFVTLGQALEMIQRDNFGILLNHHFYPLSSTPNPLEEFDSTLLSLADQLRKHYTSINTPKKLIKNFEDSDKDTITLFPPLANTVNSDLSDSFS